VDDDEDDDDEASAAANPFELGMKVKVESQVLGRPIMQTGPFSTALCPLLGEQKESRKSTTRTRL
jgi:hypothetical protein